MDNYSCLDYWYDFCKKIQNTCEQFIALFNENESENKNDPPYHRYSPIPQDIIEPKVIKKVSVTPKEVIIDIEKLLNLMNEKRKTPREGYRAPVKSEQEERRIDPKCWRGYHKQGTKLKGGVRVNNCVKN